MKPDVCMGILGGMYNPVHFGHLRAAIEARELLGLDEVRLFPCATPPHRDAPAVSAGLRSEMVAAAVKGIDAMRLDDRELGLPPPSYTLRTLESLHAEFENATFVLLLGEDAFNGLHRWHAWRQVIALCHVAVMRRPGHAMQLPVEPLQEWVRMAEVPPRQLLSAARRSGHITFCNIPALDISSTHIRELLRAGRDPRFLLPDAVLDIIRREKLYRGQDS